MSNRVFVLEESTRYDTSTASRFGRLEYIYKPAEYRPPLWSNAFVVETISRLHRSKFDCRSDYVLMVGSFVPNILLAVHAARSFDELNFLLFDAVSSEYVLHKVL